MSETASFERDNIAYWTNRSEGYSAQRLSELGSGQRQVWKSLLTEEIGRRFRDREPGEIKILDAGTGPGFFAVILAEAGYRVTAADYTQAMLDRARRNAGPLSDRIEFVRADVQALSFPDGSFDAVVSRNVTWDLPDPARAYFHWARVLRPGGLLLNFDANWYRYLRNEEARRGYLRDRRNVAERNLADEIAGTDVAAMESIADRTPLVSKLRPAWDIALLTELGMEAGADLGIWRRVWTDEQRVNNASTPMFMVRGVKPAP